MERRFISKSSAPVKVETREDGTRTIVGYGAVFHRSGDAGTEYELWDDVVEHVGRSAFDRALIEDDPRGLFNHDSGSLLGRFSAGTLRLSVDEIGLRYEIDVPDTQVGRDTVVSIERGDLTGSSFAFIPRAVKWESAGGRDVRTLEDVELFDVGPVTYPAYEATTTGTRSADVRNEYDDWRNSTANEAEKVAVNARAAEISRPISGLSA